MERIAAVRPTGIILREKELNEADYENLARKMMGICKKYGVVCILHTFTDAACRLDCPAIHLPLSVLRERAGRLQGFDVVGASVHSVSEAVEAEKLGATYITAGHIFATCCKENSPPRGLPFLKGICQAVMIPVYAIGGITPDNAAEVVQMGAKGVCVMSGWMQCEDPLAYRVSFRQSAD